jgi:hypothetical protein
MIHINICFNTSFSEDTQLKGIYRAHGSTVPAQGAFLLAPMDLPWQILNA